MSRFVGDRQNSPKQLNAAAAVDLGSELASEGFLLIIAVVLLVLENRRSSNKDKKKEDQIKDKFAELEDNIAKQKESIDNLQSQIDVLITHQGNHSNDNKGGVWNRLDHLMHKTENNPTMPASQ